MLEKSGDGVYARDEDEAEEDADDAVEEGRGGRLE